MTIKTGLYVSKSGNAKLNLKVEGNIVSGTYQTGHGRPAPDEVFPITGFVNEKMIGFICSWGKYKSITSWCGKLDVEDGRECIKAVWHLGRMYADKELTIENDTLFSFLTYTGVYYLADEE